MVTTFRRHSIETFRTRVSLDFIQCVFSSYCFVLSLMISLLRYDYFYYKDKTVMFLLIKEEEVSSILFICFTPCSLCCDVKQYKNKHKKIISSTYVKKDVVIILSIINHYYQLLIDNLVKVLPDIMHC